jgi:hypothetical protein
MEAIPPKLVSTWGFDFVTILDQMVATNWCLSVVTTVILTLIIVLHILRFRQYANRQREGATGKITKSAPYTAMEIVVESSALYSVTAILWIPFRMMSSMTDRDQLQWYTLVYPFFSAMVVCSLFSFHFWSIDVESLTEYRSDSGYDACSYGESSSSDGME